MDLELTPEQHELRSIAADLLARRLPDGAARAFLEGAGDTDRLWNDLRELGWYGVGLDDDDPFGIAGLCVLAQQIGRRVAPTLLVDVAVCARIVAGAGDPAVRDAWLEPLASGDVLVSLAVLEERGSWAPDGAETIAVAGGDGDFRVSGTKLAVAHGASAHGFGVLARVDDEPAFLLVRSASEGVSVLEAEGVDGSLRPARLVLDDVRVPADGVIWGPDAAAAIARAFDVGAVATAAEATGAAAAALDLAIAYAGGREQFGRPIGRFQAVQHLLADAHVLRETAWSTSLYAAAALDEDADDAVEAAAVAKAHASTAARRVVETALQVLGGIGFTWEHDLHLLLRRTIEAERRFGDAAHHEARLAAVLSERAAADLVTQGA